jgi:phage protein D
MVKFCKKVALLCRSDFPYIHYRFKLGSAQKKTDGSCHFQCTSVTNYTLINAADKSAGKSAKKTTHAEKQSPKKSNESMKPREKSKNKEDSATEHVDSAAKKDKRKEQLDKSAATKKGPTVSTTKNANKKSNHSDVSRSGSKTDRSGSKTD